MKALLKRTVLYDMFRWAKEQQRKMSISRYRSVNTGALYCIGCRHYWKAFRPFPAEWYRLLQDAGWAYSLDDAETLNHENYSCYGCGINDRDRLYILFFESYLKPEQQYNIVEFAPTPVLGNYFRKFSNVKHRTSDLFMEKVDDRLDLQDLHAYNDEQFDFFICSHILEHVDDDIRAMKELYRITKKGGSGITMVPIMKNCLVTHEDPDIKDVGLRRKYFGQQDHVRLYAKKDFINRLESVGFRVQLMDAAHFGQGVFEKNAITSGSVLYIVNKQ